MLPHVPGVQMQRKISLAVYSCIKSILILAIPDDIMDVDRVVDEDKDSDPDKVNELKAKIIYIDVFIYLAYFTIAN